MAPRLLPTKATKGSPNITKKTPNYASGKVQTCAASHNVKSSQSHVFEFFQISKKVKVMSVTLT
jgi:hypothetical protein